MDSLQSVWLVRKSLQKEPDQAAFELAVLLVVSGGIHIEDTAEPLTKPVWSIPGRRLKPYVALFNCLTTYSNSKNF